EAPLAALEHGRAFMRRYAELTDPPRAASALGDLCAEICGDIEGPKASVRRSAEKFFTGIGSDE
ncbi:hypothetical protein, partial [Staphylococcus aureus]|uniref:hypothetical protein n=1 Tax=Staphylococcus aureus TaxID=1280 RepID=UPI0032B6E5E6